MACFPDGDKMHLIIACIFILLFALSFVYIGVAVLSKMLGGAMFIYYLLPVGIAVAALKNKEYAKILWSVVLTYSGLVLVNYVHSYFTYNQEYFTFFTLIYLILIPVWFISLGYGCTIQSFLLPVNAEAIERKEDSDAFRYYLAGVVATMGVIPMAMTIPLLDLWRNASDINSIGYEIGLGIFILSNIYLLFESRKITKETLNYFAKPFRRFDTDAKKIKKCFILGTLFLVISSAGKEWIYRGHWIIWGETMALFIMYNLLLFKLGQVLFLAVSSHIESPSTIYLPSVKGKKLIIMIIFTCLFAILCAFIGQVLKS